MENDRNARLSQAMRLAQSRYHVSPDEFSDRISRAAPTDVDRALYSFGGDPDATLEALLIMMSAYGPPSDPLQLVRPTALQVLLSQRISPAYREPLAYAGKHALVSSFAWMAVFALGMEQFYYEGWYLGEKRSAFFGFVLHMIAARSAFSAFAVGTPILVLVEAIASRLVDLQGLELSATARSLRRLAKFFGYSTVLSGLALGVAVGCGNFGPLRLGAACIVGIVLFHGPLATIEHGLASAEILFEPIFNRALITGVVLLGLIILLRLAGGLPPL